MKLSIVCSILLSLSTAYSLIGQNSYPWAVIGAGPAGIISVAVLIDNGVIPQDIIWIDPEFKVGRMGKYYGNVPSNLKACRYTFFLQSCDLFKKIQSESFERIKCFDQQQEPLLQLIIDPLQDITSYLRSLVTTYCGNVQKVAQKNDVWALHLTNYTITARKVILAIGAYPKTFDYRNIQEIPLDIALDENKLKLLVTEDDKIIVVGSAHSALLIVKYLSEMNVKSVLNIYSKAPKYGMYGGLEGITAYWTKEILEKKPPANVTRILFSEKIIEKYQKDYNKITYAHGYQRHPLIINELNEICFDNISGKILPNLYGIGIAFPEKYITSEGETVSLIGVNSFMSYAKKLVPLWIKE